MLGVVNDAPVPNDVPPVAALYQLIVPALAVAVGIALTVAATDVLVAVVHPFAVASTK